MKTDVRKKAVGSVYFSVFEPIDDSIIHVPSFIF